MNRTRKQSRKESRDSSSSKSSSGSSSESVEVFIKQKVHKKTEKCEKRVKSSSSSSSSSSDHKEKKCKNKKSDRSSSSSDKKSDCEKKERCSFEEIYKCYKKRLLEDPTLMITGSNAYINSFNNITETFAEGQLVPFPNNSLAYNVDNLYSGSPFYVREAGVYLLFFIINTEQGAQFCVYVNGKEVTFTRSGVNSGAGQLLTSALLTLDKNDAVLIRNSFSATTTITSTVSAGGVQLGNPATVILFKLSPEHPAQPEKWDDDCISKRKLCLFKKLKEKLVCDKELMVRGFNVHGSFYNMNAQSVALEADVVFDSQLNVNGLQWNSTNPSQVVVKEDGIYKVLYLANVTLPTQLALTVNGVPLQESIQGINKGAAQVSGRMILELRKNDVLTVRNHSSAVGTVGFAANAGGLLPAISTLLNIFKISQICKPNLYDCKPNKHCEKYYCKLKNYLLNQCDLQLTGSSAYISSVSDSAQQIVMGAPNDWNINVLSKNIYHAQGTPSFTVKQDGVYAIFVDNIVSKPPQFTVFVNGVPDLTTTSGRDSGGGKELLRQFIRLCKGDMVTVNNYQSNSGTLVTSDNAGGQTVGISMSFLLFKLSPAQV
jgi:hypothetical protein